MNKRQIDLTAIDSAYAQELERCAEAGDPDYAWALDNPDAVDTCTTKMLRGVLDGGKFDWYRHNPALRRAGKSLGLKTSREFREALKALCA